MEGTASNNKNCPSRYVLKASDFRQLVEERYYTDFDGAALPARDGKVRGMAIKPSQIDLLPQDVPHVVWCSR